jgi:sarcosine oxidase, subunit beta
MQRRGGIARHDAVAWGYARAADALGVDIIQNCEVTGFRFERGRVDRGRDDAWADPRRPHRTRRRRPPSVLAGMAGFRLPLVTYALQAFVSSR